MSYASPLSVALDVLPARSWMPDGSVRSRPRVPAGPVFAVTVHVTSDPVTLLIDAPEAPLPDSEKFGEPTPVTGSSNVTVHDTLAAFVGFASATAIDETVGGMLSLCGMLPHDVAAAELANRAAIHAKTTVLDAPSGMWPP